MSNGLCLNFVQDNLVSNVDKSACEIDATFSGAMGLALATRRSGKVKAVYVTTSETLHAFDTCGGTVSQTLRVPAGYEGLLTDVTYNPCCEGFEISSNGVTGPAKAIVALLAAEGLGGANPAVNPLFIVVSPNPAPIGINMLSLAYYDKHVYVTQSGQWIYKVDQNWQVVDRFTDQDLVNDGYTPFGIRVVRVRGKCRLAVTFIPQNPLSVEIPVPRGEGYIDMFRPDGSFYRFANRGPLWIPFASFNVCVGGANVVGVSNRGDGRINFFDEKCGRFLSPAFDAFGNVLSISGLGGVEPDPRKAVLYFAASLDSPNYYATPFGNGLFGRLTLVG